MAPLGCCCTWFHDLGAGEGLQDKCDGCVHGVRRGVRGGGGWFSLLGCQPAILERVGMREDLGVFGERIGGVEVLRKGTPVGGARARARSARAMREPRVEIRVHLGLGSGCARLLTTDLSYDYVRINADYTT